VAFAILAACGAGSACTSTTAVVVPGGDINRGHQLIVQYGCGSCHTIPGVKGADALVGPPLIHWARRSYIAGELANTPANLIIWLENPKAVEPGTDMPNLGISEQDARSIAAYLDQIQ
jgi:cytochrome c2